MAPTKQVRYRITTTLLVVDINLGNALYGNLLDNALYGNSLVQS